MSFSSRRDEQPFPWTLPGSEDGPTLMRSASGVNVQGLVPRERSLALGVRCDVVPFVTHSWKDKTTVTKWLRAGSFFSLALLTHSVFLRCKIKLLTPLSLTWGKFLGFVLGDKAMSSISGCLCHGPWRSSFCPQVGGVGGSRSHLGSAPRGTGAAWA